MKIRVKSSNMPDIFTHIFQLPANLMELRDMLDQLGIDDPRKPLTVQIESWQELPELDQAYISGDIYRLNLLAERIKGPEFPQGSVMNALISMQKKQGELRLDSLLLMTYGLDSVPVWPCSALVK